MTEKKHAKFSASGAERWLACPGSIRLSEGIPSRESKYAREGTEAHECLEALLKSSWDDFEMTKIKLLRNYPHDMIEYAAESAKIILDRVTDAKLLVEQKIQLPVSEPDTFGTADAVWVEPFGELQVIDFKYGAGHIVSPIENPQLIYYAVGVADQFHYNFSSVKLIIIQPRAVHEDGPVREWETDIETLLMWRDKFEEGIKRAKKFDAPLNPGKHCKWCPASIKCPAISSRALQSARIDFEPVKDEKTLTTLIDVKTRVQPGQR